MVLGFIWFLLAKLSMDISFSDHIAASIKDSLNKIYLTNKEYFDATSGEEVVFWKEMFANPEMLVKKVIWWLPGIFFISGYFVVWLTLSLTLQYRALWRDKFSYPYTIRDLMNFTTPEWFVYVLIGGLLMAFGGNTLQIELLESVGSNVLISLGLFYFFEGIGIVHDFLRVIRILAPFRTLMLVMIVMSAWRMLVLVGLLNYWVNFRKLMKKKRDNNI